VRPHLSGRRILLATIGSLGDLHPYLALGRELKARGHSVVFATLRHYADRVAAEGLEFHAMRPDLDPTDPAELRRAMDRRKGPEYVVRDVALGRLRESFEDVRTAARDVDLVVTHPIAFGAQLVARASGRPWVSVALSPLSLFSATDPPVFSGLPFADRMAGLRPGFQRLLLRLVDLGLRSWLAPYRAIEAELGLPRAANPVVRGQHSPHLVLALFSPVLGPPQADWPANTVATGFPFLETGGVLAPEIEAFLDAGEPPVVFTLGSAAVGRAGGFYEHSIEAVTRLGRRALLLIGRDPANRPRRELPDTMLAVPYAPHAAVFRRASVVVHQGGIGTTGEALRAGRPMLVVPYSQDQPDHARRLSRLGVARRIAAERYDARRATRALSDLLTGAHWGERARTVAEAVRAETGVATACDALERLLWGQADERRRAAAGARG
jgi:UDP:flavonoid glycosyltransferase YjiC (YdhE family)